VAHNIHQYQHGVVAKQRGVIEIKEIVIGGSGAGGSTAGLGVVAHASGTGLGGSRNVIVEGRGRIVSDVRSVGLISGSGVGAVRPGIGVGGGWAARSASGTPLPSYAVQEAAREEDVAVEVAKDVQQAERTIGRH